MKIAFIILGIVVALLAASLVYVSWLLFSMACAKRVPKVIAPLMNKLVGDFGLGELDMVKEGRKFYSEELRETWNALSRDGLCLSAQYIPCDGARATMIMFHGYRSSALHDFSGVLPYYRSLGLNILLCDHRTHGESEGKYITFGVLERFDVLAWVEEHNKRLGENMPVILDGISMGGATVAFSADLDLPKNVVGIIDDCGYSSPKEQIHYVMGLLKIPVFPFYHTADLMARCFAHFSFSGVDGRKALARAKVPCLFIHGEADDFVPCKMGIECHDACPTKKKIFICKDAGHGLSYIKETEKCKEMLREFVDEIL